MILLTCPALRELLLLGCWVAISCGELLLFKNSVGVVVFEGNVGTVITDEGGGGGGMKGIIPGAVVGFFAVGGLGIVVDKTEGGVEP